MSLYIAERADGSWRVVDATGLVASLHGPGSSGAAAAEAEAERLNRRNGPAAEVRAWRAAHSLSQVKLASLLGVPWLTVQRWEAGTHRVPPFLHLALRQLGSDLATRVPQSDAT